MCKGKGSLVCISMNILIMTRPGNILTVARGSTVAKYKQILKWDIQLSQKLYDNCVAPILDHASGVICTTVKLISYK